MSALINDIIAQQQFEAVGEQLGAIIATELANQATLQGDADINATVFYERSIVLDLSELPAVNVRYNRGDYDKMNRHQDNGSYVFYIDVYTKAKDEDDERGDRLAAAKLKKIMGIIRAILANPVYETLGFDRPSIIRTSVNSLYIPEKISLGDATNVMQGRIEYTVEVPEKVTLKLAKKVTDSITRMLLADSDVGYTYAWSVKAVIEIGPEGGSTFTLPEAYQGFTVGMITDEPQAYTGLAFTQEGNTITLENGASLPPGRRIYVWFGENNYFANVTITEEGSTIPIPAALRGKSFYLVGDGNQTYTRAAFTQTDDTITMTNGAYFPEGAVVTLWWGTAIANITAEAGNTYTLPEDWEGFEHAMVVTDNQAYTADSIAQDGLTGTMTNGITFYDGQILTIILR